MSTSPLTRHLRMIADGIEDQHKAGDVRHAADLLDQQRDPAQGSELSKLIAAKMAEPAMAEFAKNIPQLNELRYLPVIKQRPCAVSDWYVLLPSGKEIILSVADWEAATPPAPAVEEVEACPYNFDGKCHLETGEIGPCLCANALHSPAGKADQFMDDYKRDVTRGLIEENKRLLAEVAAYAGQNTNLRNDLVQCGMARDHFAIQVESMKRSIKTYAEMADACCFDEIGEVCDNCRCSRKPALPSTERT